MKNIDWKDALNWLLGGLALVIIIGIFGLVLIGLIYLSKVLGISY